MNRANGFAEFSPRARSRSAEEPRKCNATSSANVPSACHVGEASRPAALAWTTAELWGELFPAGGDVEIEIGSGDGTFLMAIARRHPDRNFVGIER